MKLIVGLGNPGFDYTNNRHNVGFACLSYFAKQHDITLNKKQGQARVGIAEIDDIPITLARPQIFMNLSGEVVAYLVDRYQIDTEDLIIIHDDLDLPFGRVRIRRDGGSGGHNGVESVMNSLESSDFIRLRIGIGRPPVESPYSRDEIIGYVLGDFTEEEKEVMIKIFAHVSKALECLITEGLVSAMNRYNGDIDDLSDRTVEMNR